MRGIQHTFYVQYRNEAARSPVELLHVGRCARVSFASGCRPTYVSLAFDHLLFVRPRTDPVVSWGQLYKGTKTGTAMPSPSRLFNIDTIVSNGQAFAGLKKDGTVLCWGSSADGGDATAVSSKLTNVTQVVGVGIYASDGAFAALKTDGTVVTWGSAKVGGDSASVAGSLTGVTGIYASGHAFAALKTDGTVVTWPGQSSGQPGLYYGGWKLNSVGAAVSLWALTPKKKKTGARHEYCVHAVVILHPILTGRLKHPKFWSPGLADKCRRDILVSNWLHCTDGRW